MAGTAVWQKPPRCSCHCPLLSSTADPAVATSALLKGYFAITASRAPAQSPIKDRKHGNQWPRVCTHCFGCVAVSHYPTILLKEHASSLEIIPSRMAFVILTLENKQSMLSPWCFRRLKTEYTCLAYRRGIQIHLQGAF